MKLPRLPVRKPENHKGDFGRVLLIGGSRGMTGAIVLSASAAIRSGAGLVTVGVPDRCLETVAAFNPCYMSVPLPNDENGRLSLDAKRPILDLASRANCLAIGPGLSINPGITRIVAELYRSYPGPMVIDADALNALAALPAIPMPAGERILTPHIGEFRRLIREERSVESCRARATDFAANAGAVVVLKGHRTLITNGEALRENSTGNPGMATGGSGDVLTGIISALLGQGMSAMDAATLGVHVHGLAGDLAAGELGQVSLTAEDLVSALPLAFQELKYDAEPSQLGAVPADWTPEPLKPPAEG